MNAEFIKGRAEKLIGLDQLQLLEQNGMTIAPISLIELLENLQGEDILFIKGRPLIVGLASPNEVERVMRGMATD